MDVDPASDISPLSVFQNPFSNPDWSSLTIAAPTLASCRSMSKVRHYKKRCILLFSKLSRRSSQSKPCTTFHYFAKLPTELRCKIWDLALPSQYILHIYFGYRQIRSGDWHGTWTFGNGLKSISNLAVCQESRAEALRRGYIQIRMNGERRWMNAKEDIMFWNIFPLGILPAGGQPGRNDLYGVPIDPDPAYPSHRPPIKEKLLTDIQNLAISGRLWTDSVEPNWLGNRASMTQIVLHGCNAFCHPSGGSELKFLAPKKDLPFAVEQKRFILRQVEDWRTHGFEGKSEIEFRILDNSRSWCDDRYFCDC